LQVHISGRPGYRLQASECDQSLYTIFQSSKDRLQSVKHEQRPEHPNSGFLRSLATGASGFVRFKPRGHEKLPAFRMNFQSTSNVFRIYGFEVAEKLVASNADSPSSLHYRGYVSEKPSAMNQNPLLVIPKSYRICALTHELGLAPNPYTT
jgi:hypothetical protein